MQASYKLLLLTRNQLPNKAATLTNIPGRASPVKFFKPKCGQIKCYLVIKTNKAVVTQ